MHVFRTVSCGIVRMRDARVHSHSSTSVCSSSFGWGSLSIAIAKRYGCRVTGITLSAQQLAFATARVKQEKLAHLIDYHLIDYRMFQPGRRACMCVCVAGVCVRRACLMLAEVVYCGHGC